MSIGYCRKCKLIFRETGTCVCGRKLNSDNEQYLEAYLEHGYVLYINEPEIDNDVILEKNDHDSSMTEDKDSQEKRQDRRAEKKRQREQILKSAESQPTNEEETEFDTASFLNSLGLRVKASAT